MGALRDAMVAEMRLRGFADRTQDTYAHWVRRLVAGEGSWTISSRRFVVLLELSGRVCGVHHEPGD
jgi:hypothetical protein